ncbi:diguanylate cyclase (GGDEF)-like protein [Actinoplanes lutulentus]|uniref:GGDEF domain-containing protein n=1 Tax=Actinoplanes lutulentus TaxID=1287878 RepID=UPI000DB90C22|nr:GGDEF domain-containing protein [Actinoplanes lutulentus]MBB2943865.1 diguanylate cyclase (GGDEF)-like protein [Actinoplanes lutulentus]
MPFQIRDQHGAARAVAYLMLAASPYNIITGVLMKLGDPLPELIAVTVTAVAFLIIGLICLRRPRVMPRAFWVSLPVLSALAVTGLNYATEDTTVGAQLFYLWPLLFAASFLSRWVIAATVVTISGGHALVAYSFTDTSRAMSDWIALTVAMAMTAFVVTNLRERNDRLREVLEAQATSDSLTGAANRRAFDESLTKAVRLGGTIALVMVDVDHFKTINDTWGHATGDRALCAVADALRSAAPDGTSMVARLGGDEFAVLLRAGPGEALAYAEKARTTLGTTTDLPGGPPQLSIGVAVLPDHAGSAEELQRVADTALYQAKAGGRGRSALAQGRPPRHNVDQVPEPDPFTVA